MIRFFPSVEEGLTGAGAPEESIDSEAAFNARLNAKISGATSSDSSIRAEAISEAKRYEKMRAGARSQALAAVPIDQHSEAAIKESVLDESNAPISVAEELSRQREPKPDALPQEMSPEEYNKLSREQQLEYDVQLDAGEYFKLREIEARAPDPTEHADLVAEVWESRVQSAYETAMESDDETDWGIWHHLARQFATEAPAAFDEYMSSWDEEQIAEWDDWYGDPFSDEYPDESGLPSIAIGGAIKRELAEEQAQSDNVARLRPPQVRRPRTSRRSGTRSPRRAFRARGSSSSLLTARTLSSTKTQSRSRWTMPSITESISRPRFSATARTPPTSSSRRCTSSANKRALGARP
jgi:hypothetical protein